MIIVSLKERRLLTLIRQTHPDIRRRLLRTAMAIVSDSIRSIPDPTNDNEQDIGRDHTAG